MKSPPNYGRLAETIRIWSELHVSATSKFLSWNSAAILVESAKVLDEYALGHLNQALDDSGKALFPLGEPLKLNLGKHRWLSADREESYSDWLAWILQGISGSEILRLFAIRDEAARNLLGSGRISVHREVWGKDRDSRTDIEVRFGERGLLIVEVKVHNPGSELEPELDRFERASKHKEYRELILLAIEEPVPGVQLSGFGFVNWQTLCQRLRQCASSRLKEGESKLLHAAAILIFCGAVEQNLLGFSCQPRRFHATPTVNYLSEWRREI